MQTMLAVSGIENARGMPLGCRSFSSSKYLGQLYSAMTFPEKRENYIHPKILRSRRGVSILKCPLAPSAGSKSHCGPV